MPSSYSFKEIGTYLERAERVVFVSGNFNVIHPGHLRMLNFAHECGDLLLVGVSKDGQPGVFIPQDMRLEGVQSIGVVDYAFILPESPEQFIADVKPHIVVKGKEHENHHNPEQVILESYGGKLIFSSGEVRFSSLNLLQQELREISHTSIRKPTDFRDRHGFDCRRLATLLKNFSTLRVIVIGDLIVDEYVTCDPLGMSQEDPTIVVTPVRHDKFIGGAGIVAAHAAGLGVHVSYFGVIGKDESADFARKALSDFGVEAHLFEDESRPTTLKQRYRARGKTLLRVSRVKQHEIGHDLVEQIQMSLETAMADADLVVFSDFNYGCLPQALVDRLIARCLELGIPMAADSQSSSQLGDVSRFKNMLLVTPTEHEARLAVRDHGSGLAVVASTLQKKASAENVFLTLGGEGMLVHSPGATDLESVTDQLPAFNSSPKDVSGAGDSLLISAALAMVVGGSVWEGAYLGSVVAACQVGRVGNTPLNTEEVMKELMT